MLAHSPMRVHFELGEYKNWPGRVEFCIEHIRDICLRASAQKIVSHTIIVMQNIKKVIVVTAKKSHYHESSEKFSSCISNNHHTIKLEAVHDLSLYEWLIKFEITADWYPAIKWYTDLLINEENPYRSSKIVYLNQMQDILC